MRRPPTRSSRQSSVPALSAQLTVQGSVTSLVEHVPRQAWAFGSAGLIPCSSQIPGVSHAFRRHYRRHDHLSRTPGSDLDYDWQRVDRRRDCHGPAAPRPEHPSHLRRHHPVLPRRCALIGALSKLTCRSCTGASSSPNLVALRARFATHSARSPSCSPGRLCCCRTRSLSRRNSSRLLRLGSSTCARQTPGASGLPVLR